MMAEKRQDTTSEEIIPNVFFTPAAFGKAVWAQHYDQKSRVEIGGMCITHKDNPLLITDFLMPRQRGTGGSIEYIYSKKDASTVGALLGEAASDSDFIDEEVPNSWDAILERLRREHGIESDRCNRHNIHTHPFPSATPSSIDWRCFKGPAWASHPWSTMIILADDSKASCHIALRTPFATMVRPTGIRIRWDLITMPLEVSPMDEAAWIEEYKAATAPLPVRATSVRVHGRAWDDDEYNHQDNYYRHARTTYTAPPPSVLKARQEEIEIEAEAYERLAEYEEWIMEYGSELELTEVE